MFSMVLQSVTGDQHEAEALSASPEVQNKNPSPRGTKQSRAAFGNSCEQPGSPLQPGVNKPLFSAVSQPFNHLQGSAR